MLATGLLGDRFHVTNDAVKGFHVEIGPHPGEPDGHPTLYKVLVRCLAQASVPYPDPGPLT